MKVFLEKIRIPQKSVTSKYILATVGFMLFGFALGVFQKWIDGTASNYFPMIFQQLNVVNYFGRLSIWILLGTIISVYSKSPLRASINTFSFLISMLMGYYLYCNYVLDFLPKTYMMIWVVIACVWHTCAGMQKEKGFLQLFFLEQLLECYLLRLSILIPYKAFICMTLWRL